LKLEVFADAVGRRAADLIADLVGTNASAVVGLATGSTPEPAYRELVRRCDGGELDLSAVTVFLLDEYVGLPRDHPSSYHSTICRELTDLVGIPNVAVHSPGVGPTSDTDPGVAAQEYEAAIDAAGGIGLQLLGIGQNGHLAFSEPGTPFDAPTRVADLAVQTRRDNARFFASIDEVPRQAITQGPATILRARCLVLLATGEAKATAVRAALQGPVSPTCPASLIRRHADVVVVLDRAAASLLD